MQWFVVKTTKQNLHYIYSRFHSKMKKAPDWVRTAMLPQAFQSRHEHRLLGLNVRNAKFAWKHQYERIEIVLNPASGGLTSRKATQYKESYHLPIADHNVIVGCLCCCQVTNDVLYLWFRLFFLHVSSERWEISLTLFIFAVGWSTNVYFYLLSCDNNIYTANLIIFSELHKNIY